MVGTGTKTGARGGIRGNTKHFPPFPLSLCVSLTVYDRGWIFGSWSQHDHTLLRPRHPGDEEVVPQLVPSRSCAPRFSSPSRPLRSFVRPRVRPEVESRRWVTGPLDPVELYWWKWTTAFLHLDQPEISGKIKYRYSGSSSVFREVLKFTLSMR